MLILVQNGETVYTGENKITGSVDVRLTPKGAEQALDLGRKLSGTPIDVAFSSNLIRSKDTAWAILAEQTRAVPLIDLGHSELDEQQLGLCESLSMEQALEKYPRERYRSWDCDFYTAPPMGESMAQVALRVGRFYKSRILPFLNMGRTVLVVGHPGPNRILYGIRRELHDDQTMRVCLDSEPIMLE